MDNVDLKRSQLSSAGLDLNIVEAILSFCKKLSRFSPREWICHYDSPREAQELIRTLWARSPLSLMAKDPIDHVRSKLRPGAYDGKPSHAQEALAAMQPKREPAWRDNCDPLEKFNVARFVNWEALQAQCVGDVTNPACKHCVRNHGPWAECVTVPGFFKGSCANCHYNSSGARCSLRSALTVIRRRAPCFGLNIASFYKLQVRCAFVHILHATGKGEKIEQVQHEPLVRPKATLPTVSMVPAGIITKMPHTWQDGGYWVRFTTPQHS